MNNVAQKNAILSHDRVARDSSWTVDGVVTIVAPKKNDGITDW